MVKLIPNPEQDALSFLKGCPIVIGTVVDSIVTVNMTKLS